MPLLLLGQTIVSYGLLNPEEVGELGYLFWVSHPVQSKQARKVLYVIKELNNSSARYNGKVHPDLSEHRDAN
jgi:hypothetical protein